VQGLDCVTAGGQCLPLARVVRLAKDASGRARGWLVATDGEVSPKPIEMPQGTFDLHVVDDSLPQRIPFEKVTSILFATRAGGSQ
jgi:hypothetical protein